MAITSLVLFAPRITNNSLRLFEANALNGYKEVSPDKTMLVQNALILAKELTAFSVPFASLITGISDDVLNRLKDYSIYEILSLSQLLDADFTSRINLKETIIALEKKDSESYYTFGLNLCNAFADTRASLFFSPLSLSEMMFLNSSTAINQRPVIQDAKSFIDKEQDSLLLRELGAGPGLSSYLTRRRVDLINITGKIGNTENTDARTTTYLLLRADDRVNHIHAVIANLVYRSLVDESKPEGIDGDALAFTWIFFRDVVRADLNRIATPVNSDEKESGITSIDLIADTIFHHWGARASLLSSYNRMDDVTCKARINPTVTNRLLDQSVTSIKKVRILSNRFSVLCRCTHCNAPFVASEYMPLRPICPHCREKLN